MLSATTWPGRFSTLWRRGCIHGLSVSFLPCFASSGSCLYVRMRARCSRARTGRRPWLGAQHRGSSHICSRTISGIRLGRWRSAGLAVSRSRSMRTRTLATP
eukprot:Amastigsp_a852475_15.p3 type:complete len:102 gc:universal Amastigsp_a852475_15:602-297(-)